MKNELISLAKRRRSIYALGKNVSFTNEEISALVKDTIKNLPTAFNNQTTRAIITFGESHDKVWDIVLARLRKEVKDDDAFAKTTAKINSFKAGYGTILYFTDTDVVDAYKKQAPLYADNFYDWSEQGMGIANFAVWTALAENELGASLQHYNPLIDDQIREAFNVPANWRLRAEMPFGSVEAQAGDKDYMDDDQRFKTFD